jgi:protoporphyrinogen/coproporphyrinogen III oxidase
VRLRAGRSARVRVAIAGGGITGLAAAQALEAQADAYDGVSMDLTLLESDNRLGGKVQSEQIGRLILERGPDAMYARTPAVRELLYDLGLSDSVVCADGRHRQSYVVRDGRLHPLPDGMQSGVPRAVLPLARTHLLTPWGKLRAAAEVLVPAQESNEDESVDAFVRRRFGSEVAERIAAPLVGGIYSSDTRRLSLMATAPYLRQTEQEHGSLLRAALRPVDRPKSSGYAAASPFLSLSGGLESLPRALHARLRRTRVRLGTQLCGIERRGPRGPLRLTLGDGEELEVDRLVLAVPAPAAARLLDQPVPLAAAQLRQVQYASVIIVALVFPATAAAQVPQGSGCIVAPEQARLMAACSWSSNKWPHCSPDGEVLVRCHLHVDGRPTMLAAGDDEMVEMVRDELRQIFGLSAAPRLARVFRWPNAIPSYSVGHLGRMETLDRALATDLPGVVVAGAAYRGVGVPECIRQGQQAAMRVMAVSN